MFPQLGAPIGFICSSATFLWLTTRLTDTELLSWGWRVPFLASALLVFVGLYVRLRLAETPAFKRAMENHERVRIPMFAVFREHLGTLILGTFAATATFVVFYLMTVFALSWGTSRLGYARPQFLIMQMIGVLFFAVTIPLSALVADRLGRLEMLIAATVSIIVFGLFLAPLLGSGTATGALSFLCVGLALMGLTYGPLGTALAELFPTAIRYTGASLTFNLAGIVGASLTPYIATYLGNSYGLQYVGYYLSGAGLITLIALIWIRARHE
jgi:MFS family permease